MTYLPSNERASGFTIVELMIVVSIIAVLSAIAVPAYVAAMQSVRVTSVANELRIMHEAIGLYAGENNELPPHGGSFGAVPAGMAPYMPKKSTWMTHSDLGQRWYWYNDPFKIYGYGGTTVLYEPTVTGEDLQRLDASLDDGVSTTGAIRYSNNGLLLYGIN